MSGRSTRTGGALLALLAIVTTGFTPDSAPAISSDIVLVHAATVADAVAAAHDAGLEVRERWDRIGVVAAFGATRAIGAVAADPRVERVEDPQPVVHYGQSAHRATRLDQALDPASGLMGEDDLPFDGSGVPIAVIDQGIDVEHPMFVQPGERKVIRNLRFDACEFQDQCDHWIEDPPHHLSESSGHGTGVHAVAAGYERLAPDGQTVRGVATGAPLVALNSIGADLRGYLSALHWLLENHTDPCGDGSCPRVRVLSISWGPLLNRFEPDSALTKLIDALVQDAGIVVSVAVGNAGGDGRVDRTNAVSKNPTPGVIGVANYHDAGSGTREAGLATHSSRGARDDASTWPDLAAPGKLRVAAPGGEYNDFSDGTSNSAPYVAGLAAILLQADPTLAPDEVERLLEATAHEFGGRTYVADPAHPGGRSSYDRGHGLVDLARALAGVLGEDVPSARPCPLPTTLTDPVDEGIHPSADILTVAARPTGEAIEFTVGLRDLRPNSASGPADVVDVRFVLFNELFELRLVRTIGDGTSGSISRWHDPLSHVGAPYDLAQLPLATDLPVRFDERGDRVTVTLAEGRLHEADPAYPLVSEGDHLTLVGAVARSGTGGDDVDSTDACSVRVHR